MSLTVVPVIGGVINSCESYEKNKKQEKERIWIYQDIHI